MPPRVRTGAGFASLIGSDSEPDFDSLPTIHVPKMPHTAEKTTGASRPRSRPTKTANRVVKPAQKEGSRPIGHSGARGALQERNGNTARPADMDDEAMSLVEDSDLDRENVRPSPIKRPQPTASSSKTARKAEAHSSPMKAARRPPLKAKTPPIEEMPESDVNDSMDVVDEVGQGGEDGEDEVELGSGRRWHDQVETATQSRKRPRPASAEDGQDEGSVRWELRELRRRYESLEARHKNLREIGVKEAERNYDRLKRQADENNETANRLISELKAELAARSSLGKQLERSERKSEDLQAKVDELTSSLTDARSEIKTLSTKLAAARNAEAGSKVPGSALKAGAARGPSAEVVQAAQAKEDLYGDLTGLIVRGMKHDGGEDVFDCIQAGRNGTLHFKLALDSAEASGSYEDVQYTYRPQLNPDRDGDLMDVLPYYLLEEITFPRPQASRFYSRVFKSLSESQK